MHRGEVFVGLPENRAFDEHFGKRLLEVRKKVLEEKLPDVVDKLLNTPGADIEHQKTGDKVRREACRVDIKLANNNREVDGRPLSLVVTCLERVIFDKALQFVKRDVEELRKEWREWINCY